MGFHSGRLEQRLFPTLWELQGLFPSTPFQCLFSRFGLFFLSCMCRSNNNLRGSFCRSLELCLCVTPSAFIVCPTNSCHLPSLNHEMCLLGSANLLRYLASRSLSCTKTWETHCSHYTGKIVRLTLFLFLTFRQHCAMLPVVQ